MQSKQLILLGPPGMDVPAQAQALSQRWQVPWVAADELLGDASDTQKRSGDRRNQALKQLRRRFEQPDAMLTGWVLSGFPQNLEDAQTLDSMLMSLGQVAPDVAYLKALPGLLMARLLGDTTASISAVRQRLADYDAAIAPVLDYYGQRLTVVNGSRSADEITAELSQLGYEETGAAPWIHDEAELNALLAEASLLVVDCMASWCGPCKLVAPMIDQLAEAYRDRARICKMDCDRNKQLPKRFGLKGMPAVMFFKEGELRETLTGVKPYQAYSSAVSRLLA